MSPGPAMATGTVMHPSGAKALNAAARLNELSAKLNDAISTYQLARDLAATPHADAERVSHELLAYHAAVQFHQRDPDPDEAYSISVETLQCIEDEGLILVPVDPRRAAAGFRLVNPTLVPAVAATEASARAAAHERDAFMRENAALLQEHEDRQRVGRIKESLDSDDPAVFLGALSDLAGPARVTRTNSLTTHDLTSGAMR